MSVSGAADWLAPCARSGGCERLFGTFVSGSNHHQPAAKKRIQPASKRSLILAAYSQLGSIYSAAMSPAYSCPAHEYPAHEYPAHECPAHGCPGYGSLAPSSRLPSRRIPLPSLPLKYRRKSQSLSDYDDDQPTPTINPFRHPSDTIADALILDYSSASSSPIATSAALGSSPNSPTDYPRVRYQSSPPRQEYYYAQPSAAIDLTIRKPPLPRCSPPSTRPCNHLRYDLDLEASGYSEDMELDPGTSFSSALSPSRSTAPLDARCTHSRTISSHRFPPLVGISLRLLAISSLPSAHLSRLPDDEDDPDPDFFSHQRRISFSTSAERDQPFIRPRIHFPRRPDLSSRTTPPLDTPPTCDIGAQNSSLSLFDALSYLIC